MTVNHTLLGPRLNIKIVVKYVTYYRYLRFAVRESSESSGKNDQSEASEVEAFGRSATLSSFLFYLSPRFYGGILQYRVHISDINRLLDYC